ncbi:hypothetical protein HN51_006828 [Arachis hypogaea]
MFRRIEPLDNSVIPKGVSDSARDSMKQTISTMLGLLPSDQFSITVTVFKQPFYRLFVSSIITGASRNMGGEGSEGFRRWRGLWSERSVR